MKLFGSNSIVGRAVVVHSGEDDLGLGGQQDSLSTGHAGARFACGILGVQPELASAAMYNCCASTTFVMLLMSASLLHAVVFTIMF